jgi:subtilisin-like proprotein convertase family protein
LPLVPRIIAKDGESWKVGELESWKVGELEKEERCKSEIPNSKSQTNSNVQNSKQMQYGRNHGTHGKEELRE